MNMVDCRFGVVFNTFHAKHKWFDMFVTNIHMNILMGSSLQ